MTIQQIAEIINKNDWAFTVFKTKPEYQVLVKHAYKVENTANYITELTNDSKATEIQIEPAKKNGLDFEHGFAKTITISIKKDNMEQNQQFTALAGLSGLGLSMSDVFTAKDKAAELVLLTAKVEKLEAENRTLDNTNRDLGFDLKLAKDKGEKKNDFVELLKSPQGLTLIGALASKFAPTPALGSPAPQEKVLDPKIQHLVNFLELESTPDATKLFFNYIVEAHQVETAPKIIKALAQTLIDYNIIPQPNKEN